jgi:hypothetical protein
MGGSTTETKGPPARDCRREAPKEYVRLFETALATTGQIKTAIPLHRQGLQSSTLAKPLFDAKFGTFAIPRGHDTRLIRYRSSAQPKHADIARDAGDVSAIQQLGQRGRFGPWRAVRRTIQCS